MKKYFNLTYLLLAVMAVMTACADDIFNSNQVTEGQKVTLNLKYANVTPKEITIGTRATDAEERKVDNLYIYVFDKNGKLKGYKELTDQSSVSQGTDSNPTTNTISDGIKTTAGESYVYAVANVSNDGLYPISTSTDISTAKSNGCLPKVDADKAQAGEYSDYTKDDLLKVMFSRSTSQINIQSTFLMSGSINSGKSVTINDNGDIADSQNTIYLNRVVAKIHFNIAATGQTTDGNSISFTPKTYKFCNVAKTGMLMGTVDAGTSYSCNEFYSSENLTTNINPTGNFDKETNRYYFEEYLPENLQTMQASANDIADRESDENSNPKEFNKAASNGSYVVLTGEYTESKSGSTVKKAEVTYYVHLGDCSANVNDYNVERNCLYTYNVKVTGVNSIQVEAEKKSPTHPGSEGFVIDYSKSAKTLTLDSHYEYMVMKFYKSQIKTLKEAGVGYYFQVNALDPQTGNFCTSDAVYVTDNGIQGGSLNGADTDWIEFAVGGTYSSDNANRGVACNYPGHNKKETEDATPDEGSTTRKSGLYGVEDFLKILYNMADEDSYTDTNGNEISWSSDGSLTVTCFIKENYYKDLLWSQYVNNIQKRSFYIANEKIDVSEDTRSIYVKAQYGVQQYNIQTFYNKDLASSLVAYGCETVNDEDELGTSKFNVNASSNGSDAWNGRINFLQDLKSYSAFNYVWWTSSNSGSNQNWSDTNSSRAHGGGNQSSSSSNLVSNITNLNQTCMRRNRDLNGDGKISDDEVRWYAPTNQQYGGLWIGENALSSESRLYTASIYKGYMSESNRKLYYSSTKDRNTFFSEEGYADNNYTTSGSYKPLRVKCVRNLKSNAIGYAETPDKYYTVNSSGNVDLSNMDASLLDVTHATGELLDHIERDNYHKPAQYFQIATSNALSSPVKDELVYTGTVNCNNLSNWKGWRVPNQREFLIMYFINTNNVYKNLSRTHYSDTNFRKSWTYTSVFTMNGTDGNSGNIRCIKVKKTATEQ
jgi:hypothetical protein